MLPNRPQQERALAMDVKSMQCVMLADVADLLKIKKLKGRRNLDTSSQGLHTPPNYSKKKPYPERYATPNISIQHKI